MSIVKPNEVVRVLNSVSSTVLSTSPALIHVTHIKYSLEALFLFYLYVNEMEVQSADSGDRRPSFCRAEAVESCVSPNTSLLDLLMLMEEVTPWNAPHLNPGQGRQPLSTVMSLNRDTPSANLI